MAINRISLVHPTGNPNSRNAAIALAEANLLYEVITTVAYNPNYKLSQLIQYLPSPVKLLLNQELERRLWVIPSNAVMMPHLWKELLRICLVKSGLSVKLGLGRQGPIDWVYASLDRHVATYHLDHLDAIYAYEDGAAYTFQAAKQKGIRCFYELPIAFHRTSRQIQQEEANRFPELASSLQGVHEPLWKLERKEQEVALADHIFVASSMTRQSLLDAGINSERISVIPYGAPVDYFRPQPKIDKQFRALFVGRVGPRKGVHYLLEAWKNLGLSNAELKLIGINEFPKGWLEAYQNYIHYLPSVPHSSLAQHYCDASLLVFPSLVEGFGLVILEAMACGIPVITTPNAAGPDIITDGVEGFIIPIRDSAAIQEKLEWCYDHPEETMAMGLAARQKAEQSTWLTYRHKLASKIRELLPIV
ncbi:MULTISPECIES: glycosyltransferase family 4 protein [Cyanophyceae]|uniref:glycosyltransferase family 4 protein n=1 Tax=Cyanophyceae TaxID=3028117 RepID=UPI001687A04C|nr:MULTISPECIES: glycosyltransferase family 4 protein [Cyanophyceae]MBD1916324.1 glycosyltransferase family 4 protein [Phormidium sp. FACHB-77]MBD2032616.1 glycosyltransferase family 4 protein [Phormidium sp. FACHB-322]MBD2049988.1 glycosyltransferase family 4 protein [Leptolyngbya sp. FACHB-60]